MAGLAAMPSAPMAMDIVPTATMACAGLGELQCPRHDELPKDRGCQIKCEPSSKRCQRGRKVCANIRGCVRININSDNTWSTLKGLVRARGPANIGSLSLPWCAPEVKPPSGPSCQSTDPLCIVFALSTTYPDQYTQRPASSMPPGVPIVAAHLGDYPKRRHVAITHLTYIVDHYDSLPGALALLFDHGDRHAQSGADVCAQAIHLADVGAGAGQLPRYMSWRDAASTLAFIIGPLPCASFVRAASPPTNWYQATESRQKRTMSALSGWPSSTPSYSSLPRTCPCKLSLLTLTVATSLDFARTGFGAASGSALYTSARKPSRNSNAFMFVASSSDCQ